MSVCKNESCNFEDILFLLQWLVAQNWFSVTSTGLSTRGPVRLPKWVAVVTLTHGACVAKAMNGLERKETALINRVRLCHQLKLVLFLALKVVLGKRSE